MRITLRGGGTQGQRERKHKQKGRQGMRDTIVKNTEFGNRIFFSLVVIQPKNCWNVKGLGHLLIVLF